MASTVIAILLLGFVIARLVQLQVVQHELFAEKAQGNRVRIEPVAPIRGLIFDRKGRVIAENLPAYQLELIPEQVDDIDDTLQRLARFGTDRKRGYSALQGTEPQRTTLPTRHSQIAADR